MRSGTWRVRKPPYYHGHKYRAVPVVIDGMRFDSTKEGTEYSKLKMLKDNRKIGYFLRQTPFHLPGGVIYRCDFMVVHTDASIQFLDVKGYDTPVSKLKRKQVEALYPVKIVLA